MICKKCGSQMANNSIFCPKCGELSGGLICEQCGKPLTAKWKKCRNCGTDNPDYSGSMPTVEPENNGSQSESKVDLEKHELSNEEIQQKLIEEAVKKTLAETPQKSDSHIGRWVVLVIIVAVIALIMIFSDDGELRSAGGSMMKGVLKSGLRVGAIVIIPLVIGAIVKAVKKNK